MRTTKKIVASVLALCVLGSASVVTGFAAAADNSVGANAYVTAVEELDAEYTYTQRDLGATYSKDGTTFKVWSPTATKVTLNRYATGSDTEAGAAKLGTVELEKLMDGDKWTGVWTAYVEGDIANTYYTYTITAAHPKSGELQTVETQDPYSVATGVNGKRSMVCDLDSTDPAGWENDSHVLLDRNTQSSVWEIHVKDFSWDKASGVSDANRGKFLAFTETGTTLNNEGNVSTMIDYLKDLGITTVQINPFYDFQSINEAGKADQFNWGYDPQNYNVPEGSYSTNPYDGNVRVNECKQMIQALHNAGLSVVMDVVYNHTYSCGTDNPLQATVPDYYFRLDSKGNFSNGSGCGNEVSSERAMTRDYIIQSCLYWVNEYHIDGFRFDLMGLMDTETLNLLRDELDAVDPRITTWGEGWTGGTSTYPSKTCTGATYYQGIQANASKLNARIAFFSDSIRNAIKGSVFDTTEKGFIAGNNTYAKNIRFGALANTRAGSTGWVSSAPSQTVTYAACHDNATLYDQIISSNKLDEYGVRYENAVSMNKMAAGIVYTSQGVSFILAGEEMARTKYGDTNSYISPASINQINWQNIVDYADVVAYYRGMNEIKQHFTPFTTMGTEYDSAYIFNGTTTLTTSANQVAFTVTNDTEGEWKKVAVLHNAVNKAVNVTLKDTSCTSWVIIANDKHAGLKNLGEVTGSKITVPAYSTVVAVDKESFDALSFPSETGTVIVKYVHRDGTELAGQMEIDGKIGTGYQTGPSAGISNVYEVDHIEGNPTGVFTEADQTVTYVYTDYVPASIKDYGDLNKDGAVNVVDASELQKYLVGLAPEYTSEEEHMDFNYDGSVNIADATMLQKYAVGYALSKGSVIANYYYTDAEGNKQTIIDPVTQEGRVGDDYTTDEYRFLGFALDESKAPANASGKVPYGAAVEVNYYYVQTSTDVTLHVKHGGSETYTPYLWIWGSDLKGKDAGNYSPSPSWPGGPMTEGEDGWFTYSFNFDGMGTYNVIVNNGGAPQTQDYKGFIENDLWIIIDDANAEDKGDYLKFYDGNPETGNPRVVVPN